MRGKEEAHDYRYFPDPDLAPVRITAEQLETWRSELPELPQARKARFMEQYGLPEYDAALLIAERVVADFYAAAAAAWNEPKKLSNWMMGEFLRELNQSGASVADCRMTPEAFARLVRLVEEGSISAKSGKGLFQELFKEGGDPEALVKAKGLAQISDSGALEAVVDEVIAANPAETEAYRGGKTKLLAFFVGQVMRRTKGQANPAVVNELLAKKLAD
jgi:aspartyl-tRNA(Asn)/glutamyl-tRNA(Gln) amidotransferase subunit B